jgi:hypothetical protein
MSKENSQRPPLQPGSPLYDTPIQQQPVLSGEHQASSPPTLFTEQGRLTLYWHWAEQRFADGRLVRGRRYTQQEKAMLFADWLRTLIADGILDPREHLPAYRVFAGIPFTLKEMHVAQAIRQLRDERVLPNRKTRKDKGQPQWTRRDEYCFWLIGHMRALTITQLRRVLANWPKKNSKKGMLSLTRTMAIVDRWEEQKYAIHWRIGYRGPGWVYLTRKGLKHAGLDFRAGVPRFFDHLYWINEVRFKLEEENPRIEWISERSIQAEQEKRRKGERLNHIPDGRIILPEPDGRQEIIDIEVQISKPSPGAVKMVMGDSYFSGSNNPLRYYVNRASQGVVKATYEERAKYAFSMRPSVEIINLEEWLRPSTTSK